MALLTYATPRAARDQLLLPLQNCGIATVAIGDCKAARTVLAATSEGHAVAVEIERCRDGCGSLENNSFCPKLKKVFTF